MFGYSQRRRRRANLYIAIAVTTAFLASLYVLNSLASANLHSQHVIEEFDGNANSVVVDDTLIRHEYSSHFCKHGPASRHCILFNACARNVDGKRELLYWWDEESTPPTNFKVDMGDGWPLSPGRSPPTEQFLLGHPFESPPPDPTRMRGERPSHLQFYPHNAVLLSHERRQNFGHVIGDELLCAYQLMLAVGRQPNNGTQLLMLRDWAPIPMQHVDQIFTSLPSKNIWQLAASSANATICFDELYVGAATMAYWFNDRLSVVLGRFRHYTLTNMGLWPYPPIRHHRIVINGRAARGYGRGWVNSDELLVYFKEQTKNTTTSVEVIDFSTLDLIEQLQVIMTTSVFVAQTSGAAWIGLWLPPGASVVMMKVLDKDDHSVHYGNDMNMWAQLPNVHDFYYETMRSELEGGDYFDFNPIPARLWRATNIALKETTIDFSA